ncbi:Hpt domain-containing protein [Cryomorphaceae bacterium]|nr:Hpt domain-containing protein [Cryomorphaceae bacterium]
MDKLYNLDQLKELSGGMEDFVKSMIDTFLEHTPNHVSEMNEALNQEDHVQVGQIAHKIKPSIDLLGIENMRDLVRQIERNGKDNDPQGDLKELVSEFNTKAEAVFEQIRADF